MRRGILSSLPDGDYLCIALLRLAFNVYATICRATDRQGFLNMFNGWRSTEFDKISTWFVDLSLILCGSDGLKAWRIPCVRSDRLAFPAHAVRCFFDPSSTI
jgi:hypothetical protein